MHFLSEAQLNSLRQKYPKGTRVELVQMDDMQAPPIGTKGTVTGIDDTGSLLMKWDNGSHLNVIYGEDVVRIIEEELTFTEQIENVIGCLEYLASCAAQYIDERSPIHESEIWSVIKDAEKSLEFLDELKAKGEPK